MRGSLRFAAATLLVVGCDEGLEHTGPHRDLSPVAGDDRVGDLLRGGAVPRSLNELEQALGVGRACSNPVRGIYVIEEQQTRRGGERVITESVVPRVVFDGCLAREGGSPDAGSGSLFLVLSSDPDGGRDPLDTTTVEAMAFDRSALRYNFYELTLEENGSAMVSRFVRQSAREVSEIRANARSGAYELFPRSNGACFGCHIHGTLIMNELADPWHGWISPRKLDAQESYDGETRALVETALGRAQGSPASLASVLSSHVRAGARAALGTEVEERLAEAQGVGPNAQQAAKILLDAVLCENDLGFATSSGDAPMAVAFDPDAVADAFLGAVPTPFPVVQFPTRSLADREIARTLQELGIFTQTTLVATRLVDDEQDIFSEKRCGLATQLHDATPEVWDELLRVELRRVVASGDLGELTADYVDALLDATSFTDRIASARSAYFLDLAARLRTKVAFYETAEGVSFLEGVVAERRARARAMFPSATSPLPYWPEP